MIAVVNGLQRIPQIHKLALDTVVKLGISLRRLLVIETPQRRVGIGVKKSGTQTLAEDFPQFFLHLGRQIVAAQVVQVFEIAVDFVGIGERAVNIVEVADNELRPIDEFVKLLGFVAHCLTIGIIEGEGHLDVRCHNGTGQVGNQLAD